MLKTYSKDFKYVQNLIESYHTHNADDITLYILAPKEDNALFSQFSCATIVVVSEETIPVRYFETSLGEISKGYLNQQVVKLAFWKLGLCENYLCLDSDVVFIRNFGYSDFLTPSGQPYTVLIEDRDLQSDPEYYAAQWQDRSESLQKIQEYLGFDKHLKLQTCHGMQIFSSLVLAKMEAELLEKQGLKYIDLLTISGYEFSWYNYYLQGLDAKIYTREPYFKLYSSPRALIRDQVLGVTLEDLARGYLGLIINSNLGKSREIPVSYNPPLLKYLLGQYVSLPTLVASVILGMKRIPAIITQRFFKRTS